MSALAATFDRARGEGRAALIAYLCAGDPDLDRTLELAHAVAEAGADVLELGIPFSDPIADGPTIQAAAQRALASGTTLSGVLHTAERLRDSGLTLPLVFMSYLNPLLALGLDRFFQRAAQVGVDGLIVPDLPLEESTPICAQAAKTGIDQILLATPTTPSDRLQAIGRQSRGFLYFVSVAGVTGARRALPDELPEQLAAARRATRLPVAVGFGVATPEQARSLAVHADGVVVGSALVSCAHANGGQAAPVAALVSALAKALRDTRPRG